MLTNIKINKGAESTAAKMINVDLKDKQNLYV